MKQPPDSQLLRSYAESRSETAFAELVRRYVDFTCSAALRMVCAPHLAEDVTQGTFAALAQNASRLAVRPVLSGWLHRTAQNIAAQTVRTIERRRVRERKAVAMTESLAASADPLWEMNESRLPPVPRRYSVSRLAAWRPSRRSSSAR